MTRRIGAWLRPLSLACALAALMSGSIAAPPSYQVQVLPVPRTGQYSAEATAINQQGVVGVNYTNLANYIESAGYLCTPAQCSAIPRLHDDPKYPRNLVYALNDAGVATGISDDLMGNGFAQHAYTFDGSTLTRISGFDQDGCGGCTLSSLGRGINASGHVAGSAKTIKGRTRAFLYRDGVMLEIGSLGGHNSEALGINASDSVVGKSQIHLTGETHAFLYRAGRTRDLGSLGGDYSVATAINDRGQVVGWSTLTHTGLDVPFIYKKGQMTALPMLDGATYGRALALNEAGWVVGETEVASRERHAFLFDGTATYDLNDMLSDTDRANWQIETAAGINDLGQIAVTGRHRASGTVRAFLFSPSTVLAPR